MNRRTSQQLRQLFNVLVALGLMGSGALLTACQERVNQATPEAKRLDASPAKAAREAATAEQAKQEQEARQSGWSDGHSATVACLRGERAQTDGNELRCEDEAFVRENYRSVANR